MNIQELKDKILLMAIQGKLVKQDPNDEPATELLKRIKKEREQLIKDKKIKKNKKFPPITDSEKPFNIPDNWEWVRLGEISVFVNGDRGKNYPSRNDMVETGIPFINAGHLLNGVVDFRNMNYITAEKYNKLNGGKVQPGDIIYCLRGTLGKCAINSELTIGSIASSLLLIRMISECDVRYIYSYLISGLGKQLINIHDNGTAQPNLSAESVKSYVLPLPPVIEQQRIVKKIEQLFTLIDTLDVNKEEMLAAIKETRSKVLDEAIRGNLIKQDTNDESAEELLKRIKQEKEQLIKDKKIKKTKELPPIEDEEKPFDIPESWEWVSLNDIVQVKGGKRIPRGKSFSDSETDYVYLRVANMKKETIIEDNIKYIEEDVVNSIRNYTITSNDLYLTIAGTIGAVGTIPKKYSGMFLTENASKLVLYWKEGISLEFLKKILNSEYVQNQFVNKTNRLAQPKLALERIRTTIIPLPPIEEQQRIAHKIDQIMMICDDLERQLTY